MLLLEHKMPSKEVCFQVTSEDRGAGQRPQHVSWKLTWVQRKKRPCFRKSATYPLADHFVDSGTIKTVSKALIHIL